MTSFIPLGTTILATAFALVLAHQYLSRHRVHQLMWAVAMGLFAEATLVEFSMHPEILGPSTLLFKLYYLSVGPQVGLLGVGVAYLLSPTWGRRLLVVVLILSAGLLLTGVPASIDRSALQPGFESSVVTGIREGVRAFPFHVRIFTILLNSLGGLLLIGGAIFSYIVNRRRTYALFIAGGGILNAVGGTLLGIIGNPEVFFEFEFLGAVMLFTGFMLIYRSPTGGAADLQDAGAVATVRARMVAMSGVLSGLYLIYAFSSSVLGGAYLQGVDIHLVRALVLTVIGMRLGRPGGATSVGFVSAMLLAIAPFSSPDKLLLVPATLVAGLVFDLALIRGGYERNVRSRLRVSVAAVLSGAAESVIVVGGLYTIGWPFAQSVALLETVFGAAPTVLLLTFLVGRNFAMSFIGGWLGRIVMGRLTRGRPK